MYTMNLHMLSRAHILYVDDVYIKTSQDLTVPNGTRKYPHVQYSVFFDRRSTDKNVKKMCVSEKNSDYVCICPNDQCML